MKSYTQMQKKQITRNITSMSVLLIVGPKCTLAASHAAPPPGA